MVLEPVIKKATVLPVYSKLKDCWTYYDNITVMDNRNSRTIFAELIKPNMRCLDFGCGEQGTLGYRGRFEAENVIMDGYDNDISVSNCYHNLNDIHGTYDLILMSHVIEHCTLVEAEFLLKWCINRAKRVVLVTPNSCSVGFDFNKDLTHVRPYSTPQTCSIIEQLGGKIEKVAYTFIGEKKSLPFRFLMALGKDEKMKALYYEYMIMFQGSVN
jgi:hypothetical protein